MCQAKNSNANLLVAGIRRSGSGGGVGDGKYLRAVKSSFVEAGAHCQSALSIYHPYRLLGGRTRRKGS